MRLSKNHERVILSFPLKTGHRKLLVPAVSLLLLFTALAGVHPVKAQSAPALATQYAPVLHFASGEAFYPTSVDYLLSSSTLVIRNADGSLSTVDPNSNSTSLGSYQNANMFLDNKLGN